MATNQGKPPVDKLLFLALQLTEEVLQQTDLVVDHYRSTFFSGNDVSEITEHLGDLGSELVKLADMCISLSGLSTSIESYNTVIARIEGGRMAIEGERPPTFIKPYPRPLMPPLEDA